MQFRRFYLGMLLVFTVFLFGCGGASDSTEVVIISTNDIHAQIERFPKFAAFVAQQRAIYPNLLVVDAGDRISGNVYVDNAVERGKPMVMLMNKVGYDVATFGNHEFDYGQSILKERLEEMDFPVICANMETEGSVLEKPQGHYVLEKAGIRFCFLSMIEINEKRRIPATNPANVENVTFRYFGDVVEENRGLKEGCDVFIALTHLGYTADSVLATIMPELDVIIGGHSHTLIHDSKVINDVLVSQTGSYLRYAGVTKLDFKGKKLVNKSFHIVKLDTISASDAEVEKMLEEICNRPEFREKIGETSKGLKYKEDVASMVTDAMCDAAGCDFVFYNKGGVRLNSIPAGDITREMVYQIEPFSNYIVMHDLTLQEMKELVLNRFNGTKNPEKRYLDLFVSEGRYTILKDKEGNGVDVVFVDRNGKKLKDGQRKYKVGLSNYVNSAYDFVGKGKGTNTGIMITDAVLDFIKKQKDVNYNKRRTFIERKS
ncbi:bifunctional metallophosphatase/5'-nucleotidase [Odoribacter lunatus]|uniref:bifunctional metallophosphatase/5'-nucleotidase n=1 Tax=Odoribacter lunatus TaxID=2941335 RepID=UPI0020408099|nr:bifunctional UDP-sugar hydrolase/5'-nucleotidase [Odoribacter lunatus]